MSLLSLHFCFGTFPKIYLKKSLLQNEIINISMFSFMLKQFKYIYVQLKMNDRKIE